MRAHSISVLALTRDMPVEKWDKTFLQGWFPIYNIISDYCVHHELFKHFLNRVVAVAEQLETVMAAGKGLILNPIIGVSTAML